MQSEANNFSTVISSTESHDFMLWLTCMLHEANELKCNSMVGHLGK